MWLARPVAPPLGGSLREVAVPGRLGPKRFVLGGVRLWPNPAAVTDCGWMVAGAVMAVVVVVVVASVVLVVVVAVLVGLVVVPGGAGCAGGRCGRGFGCARGCGGVLPGSHTQAFYGRLALSGSQA